MEHLRKKILNIEESLDEAYELVGFRYVNTEEKYNKIEVRLSEIDVKLKGTKESLRGKDNIYYL